MRHFDNTSDLQQAISTYWTGVVVLSVQICVEMPRGSGIIQLLLKRRSKIREH